MAGRRAWMAMVCLLMLAWGEASAQPQRATLAAGDPVIVAAAAQIAAHAGKHRLIVLGELHGTRQLPALTAALVAHHAAQGPVTLALEVPQTEQPAIEGYLASDGGSAAWQALASTPFWQVHDDQHDGRRSVQMRQLIESLRALRLQGATVDVLAYDVAKEQADAHDHHWRDARMAANLRAAATQRSGMLLVLTGNVHAMRVRPSWAPPEMQLAPMTSQLLDLQPYAVNVTGASGQFWGCPQPAACRAIEARSWQGGEDLRIDRDPERAYDLWLRLPELTLADLVQTQD